MPVANHGDAWQKPSQLCNYLPIKIFLKVQIQISTVCTSTVFFFNKKVIFLLYQVTWRGFHKGLLSEKKKKQQQCR